MENLSDVIPSCPPAEAASVDSVRTNIDLIQTEWDVCTRELQAARDRVHTETRVRAVSVELAALNQVLEKQDRWLDAASSVEKSSDAELRRASQGYQVRFRDWIPNWCLFFFQVYNNFFSQR